VIDSVSANEVCDVEVLTDSVEVAGSNVEDSDDKLALSVDED